MRKPMVTRTITSTNVTLLCVNTDTKTVEEKTVSLPRTYADEKAVMKFVDKNLLTLDLGALKPVSMISKTEVEMLYKMDEAEFIRLATPCDPKTANEDDDADDEAPAPAPAPKHGKGKKGE